MPALFLEPGGGWAVALLVRMVGHKGIMDFVGGASVLHDRWSRAV